MDTRIVRRVSGSSAFLRTAYGGILLASAALFTAVLAHPAFAQDDSPATVLAPVVVEGESATGPDNSVVAKRSKSASKTDASLREIPQAVSVVTRKQMDEQGAHTVSEALSYTPGVFPAANGYDVRYDVIYLRGFQPSNIWLDGLALGGDTSSYASPSINPYPRICRGRGPRHRMARGRQ